MNKLFLLIALCLSWAGSAFASTACDVWVGTWDVKYKDNSAYVWVINQATPGPDSNIICEAAGTSTPAGGGAPFSFLVFKVSFFSEFIYTESAKLGEGMSKGEVVLNDTDDAFTAGTVFADYNLASGTKRVSGPRCGGLDPTYVTGGDSQVQLLINGVETSFDQTTTVSFSSTDITLNSLEVLSATQIKAVISVASSAGDQECTVQTTTGSTSTFCTLDIRGVGDTSLLVWKYPTNNIISSSPAIQDDYVYFGSVDHSVYCLNRKTGDKVWSYETGNAVQSCPLVYGNDVYIGSNDMSLYRLSADTGALLSHFQTGGGVESSPAIAGDLVYAGSFDDKVYCFNKDLGVKQWEFQTAADVYSTPAIAGGRVYVGGVDYSLYCLDAKTGAKIWSYATDGDIPPSPAIVNGYVYFGSKDGKFYCVDADTGAKKWDFTTGDIIMSSAAVANGKVYFGSLNKKFYCLNADTGVEVWEYETSGAVQSSPAVTRGYAYVGSGDGNLYCFNATKGSLIWHYKTGGPVYSSPVVAHGLVYVGSFDNNFYCLKAADDENGAWPMYRANAARTGTWQGSCLAQKLLGKHDESLAALRLFRDKILARTALGNKLVSWYYSYGEDFGVWCDSHPLAASTTVTLLRAAAGTIGCFLK